MRFNLYSFLTAALLAALCCTTANLDAQCTPLDSLPEGEIVDPRPFTPEMPQDGIQDTACAQRFFETTINFSAPEQVDLGFIGILNIDSVVLGTSNSISNLPASLSYTCNPGNCVFYPNEPGCIYISGTPTNAEIGMRNLTINVLIFANGGTGGLPFTLPNASFAPGEYRLFIEETDFANCYISGIEEFGSTDFSLRVAPNPVNTHATAIFQTTEDRIGQLRLIDAFGREVSSSTVRLTPGENRMQVATDQLPTGFYTLVFGQGRSGVSTRVLVLR